MTRRKTAAAALALAPVLMLAACASQPRAGADDAGYVDAYQQGRYDDAFRAASAAAERDDDERAALVAGLSAHAQNRSSEAEHWLRPLVRSDDDEVAGRAGATLGLIELGRGNHRAAAPLLSNAADRLHGDDAARARVHAAQAYDRLGLDDQAAEQRRRALSAAPEGRAWGTRLAGGAGRYAIQLGAYSSRARAMRVVEMARAIADRNDLGTPHVVRDTGADGRPLYLVHVGKFTTEAEAKTAQRRIGMTSLVAEVDPD